MLNIIIAICLINYAGACLQPEILRGSFSYTAASGRSYTINQVVVPKLVDTCTEDLFVHFHLPDNLDLQIGYLTKIKDQSNIAIVQQSLQLACELDIHVVLETDEIVVHKVSNVILIEHKTIQTTSSTTRFQITVTKTSPSTTTTSNAEQSHSAHFKSSNRDKSFDFEFSFYKFLNDVNDILYIISHGLHVFFPFFFKFVLKMTRKRSFPQQRDDDDDDMNDQPQRNDPVHQHQHASTPKHQGSTTQQHIVIQVETKASKETSTESCSCSTGNCSNCVCKRNGRKCTTTCHKNGNNKNCTNCD